MKPKNATSDQIYKLDFFHSRMISSEVYLKRKEDLHKIEVILTSDKDIIPSPNKLSLKNTIDALCDCDCDCIFFIDEIDEI